MGQNSLLRPYSYEWAAITQCSANGHSGLLIRMLFLITGRWAWVRKSYHAWPTHISQPNQWTPSSIVRGTYGAARVRRLSNQNIDCRSPRHGQSPMPLRLLWLIDSRIRCRCQAVWAITGCVSMYSYCLIMVIRAGVEQNKATGAQEVVPRVRHAPY